MARTKRSRVLVVISDFSIGEIIVVPVVILGADCGDRVSESSRNGLVERGRSGRLLPVERVEGERARLRKGLLEPKFVAVGETESR